MISNYNNMEEDNKIQYIKKNLISNDKQYCNITGITSNTINDDKKK